MKKERLPFRVYHLLLCLLVMAAAVLLCMAAQEAEQRWYLKLDVSESRVSELSEYTREHLNSLTQEVAVYPVWSAGAADSLRDLQLETLYRMAALNSYVTVHELDPATQPQILLSLCGETAGVPDGTVFVRNEAGTRTIRLERGDFLFSRRIAEEIYTIYCGEARLIGTIDGICAGDPTAIWFVTGHGEADEQACAMLALTLQGKGFAVHSGRLGSIQPEADDLLALIGPRQDLTPGEAEALASFLDGGGRLVAAVGADTPLDKLTQLAAVLDLYGLSWQGGWVVEHEAENTRYADRPELLAPTLVANPLLAELPGRLMMPRTTSLSRPAQRPGIEACAVLTTSDRAACKADVHGDAYAASPQDVTGEHLLAVMAEGSDSMRILLLGSVDMLLDETDAEGRSVQDSSENLAFAAACVDAMAGRTADATLDAGVKRLSAQLIAFDNAQQRQQVSILFLVGLPGAILLVMAVVLIRRRRL